jgi:hypothetical protein
MRRYQNPRGEGLDVMYRNIRYAFFQPAENDMITVAHFHLHNPIMIGNKKCKDVQFYAEVRAAVTDVFVSHRFCRPPRLSLFVSCNTAGVQYYCTTTTTSSCN